MDKALKQRLVGASVIIALVVIVLPMLLSGRPENPAHQAQDIELPARPESLAFETRRFPVDAEATSPALESRPEVKPAAQPADVTADSASGAEPSPAAGEPEETPPAIEGDLPKPGAGEPAAVESTMAQPGVESGAEVRAADGTGTSAEATSSEAASPQTASAQTASPGTPPVGPASTEAASAGPTSAVAGRYLVQVASLGSAENATRLMTALQEKGYPVLLDTVESGAGILNRVRVGPYLSESEAAAVVAEVSRSFSGVNPKLVDLQPKATAPLSESPDSLARWVVQAGSFSEAVNADRLVEQLRADGMSAYQEKVTSGASVNFRVRIGPFLDRETALKTRQALSESRSIDGVVVSAD